MTTDPKDIGNVPDPAAGLTACLFGLADAMGDAWVFQLIGGIRDHRGPGEAGSVRVTLAQRLVEAEQASTGDADVAMRIVAERLGYNGWQNRGTFYKIARGKTRQGVDIPAADAPTTQTRSADQLPDPAADIAGCLFGLADLMGDEWTFQLIGAVRDARGPGEAGAVRVTLAQRMVRAEQAATGGTERDAIRAVGQRLGYTKLKRGLAANDERDVTTGGTLGHFTKLVHGETRRKRPIGGAE